MSCDQRGNAILIKVVVRSVFIRSGISLERDGDGLSVDFWRSLRRTWHDNPWHFSVVDVISVLTDCPTPRQYRGNVKDRAFKEKAKEAAVS